MAKVYVILFTSDPDSLNVEVFSTKERALARAMGFIEPSNTFEDGTKITEQEIVKRWKASPEVEVWEEEGRVTLTLSVRFIDAGV